MIGRLQGELVEKAAPQLMIDVMGVGYELQAPMSTFSMLGGIGDKVTLFTHLSVREDAHQLFGFASKAERSLFRALVKVSGVGPKLALAILSGMDAKSFANCIHNQDAAALVRMPGIGKKTAERLIVEMKDRLKEWQDPGPLWQAAELNEEAAKNSRLEEAESALVALGYRPVEAAKMVNKVASEAGSSEELIRLALKESLR